MKAYVFLISGRVQGVGFRWFAEREASRHRVVGYVRNLADGRVEVLAQGDVAELERLEDALRRGPSSSQVVSVESRTAPVDPSLTSFEVRY
ncbi:MAG TPA: acylphosphatase [Vicinamibacteria bacterium]|nr:acylphosphatase [Vicinamibacteria bacterium]